MSARPTCQHNVGQAWRMVRTGGGRSSSEAVRKSCVAFAMGIWEAAAPAGRVGDGSERPVGLPGKAEAPAAWGFQDEGVAGL